MELFVSTTASARAAAPLCFAPLRRGGSAPSVVPLRRRLPARGWRCASTAVPDPVPSEEPASTTVVVTDKPDSPADEKGEEVGAASSGGSVEAAVAAPVSSGVFEEGGGLDDILSKLDIEVTPTLILTGSSAFVALWILSSVVSAIDSVPLLPNLLELVGIGYSIWFTARYLLFKESRDELFAKFEDLKQRII
ncbi:protein CURVATURE THYLAKOID 1D, chloroplastic-like [Phragmites australis]|uniref:protein CURVATURE THYLAKOID 1D, chloroplastic-like n=1 Tax=Phragmites australis TaxID=29695 RepID=UPI002D785AF2|nr:protein CURVATURE THYLAKOID 1D, chloroplastic-like [Phragmites australis]